MDRPHINQVCAAPAGMGTLLLLLALLIGGCLPEVNPSPNPTPDPKPSDTASAIATALQTDRLERSKLALEIATRLNEPEFDPKEHWNDGDQKIGGQTNDKLRKLIKARLASGPDEAAWRDIAKGYSLK